MYSKMDRDKRKYIMSEKRKDYHKGKKLNAYIPEVDYNLLYEYAACHETSISDMIREAIHIYLMDNIPT